MNKDNVECEYCGSEHVEHLCNQIMEDMQAMDVKLYFCHACRRTFTVKLW